MTGRRVMVLGRDPSAWRSAQGALGTAFDLVDDVAMAEVLVLPLNADGLAALGGRSELGADAADFIFTYDSVESADVARALRDGASYCVPEPFDPAVLRAVIARCLELRELKRVAREQADRLDRELARAARLQRAMLPPPEARLGGAGVSVATRCRPCAEIGGDLVDYAEADGRATVLIADVAGHGVSAALLTTLVKSAFLSSSCVAYDPAAVVAGLLPSLAPFDAGQFVTLIVARVEVKRGVIEYVNAGHPPALLFERGRVVRSLEAVGPPLMAHADGSAHPVQTAKLAAHCGLLLYTDGVTDAKGDEGRFGQERMLDVLTRCPGGGATLLDRIVASVDAFTSGHAATDDLTLATVTVGVPGLA